MRKIAALLLALLLLPAFAACADQGEEEQTGEYLLYVPADGPAAAGADAIAAVRTDLDLPEDVPLEEEAAAVVERILAEGGLWDGVQLRGISIKGSRAYVDFSSGYAWLTGIQLSLADYCVTLSLTALEGLSSVTITAEGRELPFRDTQVLMEQDVLLSTMDDVVETVEVVLYFLDEGGRLAEERRSLELYEGQTVAESAMAALLEGPGDRALSPVIPEDFEINGVRVEERVCTLGLPGRALAVLPEEEGRQRLILRSIARTLFSWGGVDELQILVDGEPCAYFGAISTEEVRFPPESPEGEE